MNIDTYNLIMRIKPIVIITLFLFTGIACNYSNQDNSTNLNEKEETTMSVASKVSEYSKDSIKPNAALTSNDPYATKGVGRPPKHDYICEVYFFDNNYQELKNLKDFDGDFGTVKRITIQRQGISSLPSIIEQFKNLEILDISHNKFEEINLDRIKGLKKLKSLYINSNKLTKEKINLIRNQLPNITIFDDEDVSK